MGANFPGGWGSFPYYGFGLSYGSTSARRAPKNFIDNNKITVARPTVICRRGHLDPPQYFSNAVPPRAYPPGLCFCGYALEPY